jgi:hypothetical protein
MICQNPSCINKSIVYRRYDVLKDQICHKCKSTLKAVTAPSGRGRRTLSQETINQQLQGL